MRVAAATFLRAAHPRACGENWGRGCGRGRRPGSSPRVRGKPGPGLQEAARRGLIPARAGKTRSPVSSTEACQAHPRVCGENTRRSAHQSVGQGSSPRVRGKPRGGSGALRGRGLIPACAGKTYRRGRDGVLTRAHPRVCGENQWTTCPRTSTTGSSPRVRGKLPRPNRRVHSHGLIPACAGKTMMGGDGAREESAHPRVCGENRPALRLRGSARGSSPRVRGKRDVQALRKPLAGLIPACAGKTWPAAGPRSSTRAHPRVCGENGGDPDNLYTGDGSSPRVRGKPRAVRHHAGQRGLIPACAGKTRVRSGAHYPRRAHPRVCGENPWRTFRGMFQAGSSPRVRGKPTRSRALSFLDGLIPACAGKTTATTSSASAARAHPRVCGENRSRRPSRP